MNRALLIHFLGFYAINSLLPSWVVSADADLLSIWYGCFALVDLIAILSLGSGKGILHQVNKFALGTSFLWSTGLAIEMMMFRDTLQQADQDMQRYFDVILGLSLIVGSIQAEMTKGKNHATDQ